MAKLAMTAVLAATLALAVAAPVLAQAADKQVCLQTNLIDHTSQPDDRTLLIHMLNHKVYKAAMVNECVGLHNSTGGISYTPTDPATNEICSNLWSIHVRDTGQTCLVGSIVPVDPATK